MPRGQAACMSAETGPTWSDIAAWYDDLLNAGSGPHETALNCLLDLVPSMDGTAVLDLACGQGLASRALATAGAARVLGVDASEAMIGLARGHGAPDEGNVSYVVDDAQGLATCDTASFAGVSCQLGLMDVGDLDATLAAVHRVLQRDGWFVFVISHPCFLVPDARPVDWDDGRRAVTVTGYFRERFWRSSSPDGVRRAGNYHRTLSTYLNALRRTGFVLEETREPTASPLLAAQQPLYREVPIFFAARARRIGE